MPVSAVEPIRACRPATRAFRQEAVARVIKAMNGRLADAMSTHSLAEIAYISPYHFNRVFRQITGIPPCQYLTALRLDTARRLLLTTALSVTDVCFEVGYNSLGTFTTRFRRSFGVSPRQMRRLAGRDWPTLLRRAARRTDQQTIAARTGAMVTGRIETTREVRGPICIGAFPTAVPQGWPIACTLLGTPGEYTLKDVPDGRWYLLAAALGHSDDVLPQLMNATVMRGRAEPGPVTIAAGRVAGNTTIVLREPDVTDPPLLAVLPILLAHHRDQTQWRS